MMQLQKLSVNTECVIFTISHTNNSLALYFFGLWVFELLGFVDVQEKVLQQGLGLAQLV